MSVHVNQQVIAVTNNLKQEHREVIQSVQSGVPMTNVDHRSLGQLVRAGIIQIGSGGGLALTNVGMRVANA